MRAPRGDRRLAVALICAACALAPRAALAEPTTAERETARSLMDEADALRAAGDAQRALERYRAADQLMHVPTTGLEVARTQARLGQLVDACATALEVANSMPARREPEVFAQARTAAQSLADALRPRIPSLTVRVEPAGLAYELRFDGVLVPEAVRGLPYKLDPGRHAVLVQAPGFRAHLETVELAEAQHIERRVRLNANTSAASPRLQPSAAVRAREPQAPSVSAPQVDAARSAELRANAAGRTRGYVALGIGGAVFVAGVATGIAAWVESESAKDQCVGQRCPPSAAPAIDRANTLANVSNITLPLGGLGVAYGLVELLLHGDGDVERGPRVAVSPWGIALRGRL